MRFSPRRGEEEKLMPFFVFFPAIEIKMRSFVFEERVSSLSIARFSLSPPSLEEEGEEPPLAAPTSLFFFSRRAASRGPFPTAAVSEEKAGEFSRSGRRNDGDDSERQRRLFLSFRSPSQAPLSVISVSAHRGECTCCYCLSAPKERKRKQRFLFAVFSFFW